jgi:hypothetical protein
MPLSSRAGPCPKAEYRWFNVLVNIISGQHLFFIEPAADTATLKAIMEAARERLVSVAVAYKAGIELYGMSEQGS